LRADEVGRFASGTPPVGDDPEHGMSEPDSLTVAPRPKRRWYQYSMRALLALPFVFAIWYMLGLIPASRIYSLKATYERMPADDSQLEAWLKVQRGVVPHTVHISREKSNLRVIFIMVRNSHGSPPFPDLSSGCELLNYTRRLSEWSDDWPENDRAANPPRLHSRRRDRRLMVLAAARW
jgi:hypothetical protein